jgi:hypothetical protein
MDEATSRRADRTRAWPFIRALILTTALALQLASAIPTEALTPARIAHAEGRRLVDWVQHGLALLGVAASSERVSGALIAATERVVGARNRALSPLDPFFHFTQTRQQWRLFLNPGRECYRLWVEGRHKTRGRWRALYRASDIDRLGLSGMLRYRRVRGIYNAGVSRGPTAAYDGFARWIAARVFAQDARYIAVRTRLERLRIGPPGRPHESLGFEHVRTRERGGSS